VSMTKRRVCGVLAAGLLVGVAGWAAPAAAEELGERALEQIRAILAEKASRTPAQRKLATSLLYASRESRGLPMVQGLAPLRRISNRARVDGRGMVVVDIRGEVTDALLQAIADVGGRVVLAVPKLGAVRASVPVRQVEAIAALDEVRRVAPRQGFLVNAVSEGDVAHAADYTRGHYGLDGAGVKIGVFSDGVDSLAARQATGDLPATCTPTTPATEACVKVVADYCDAPPCGFDEGTAMMEIIHDLAPKAQLYFATGAVGSAAFAQSIQALKTTYGCDIMVDDITYFDEGAFQDGEIARAVNAVRDQGVVFFSSAGNQGRQDAGTSGTWEGDFLNSGLQIQPNPTCPDLPDCWTTWAGKQVHSWNGHTGASAATSNELTADAPFAVTLQWSDPLGAAVTDYDLFVLDSTLSTVEDGSVEDQTVPGQNPYEEIPWAATGERIVVVRWTGATKAMRLDTFRGGLMQSTPGATFGHNAGEATVTVGATTAKDFTSAFTGGTANPVEIYSSDGPRRIFFNPNGTAITPGKVTFASGGGVDLQKPDITAADCVKTAFPASTDFNPFCGTSAAAPHAAAIAALLRGVSNNPSAGQVLSAMYATALDVTETPAETGWDRNSGVGIVMADQAAAALIDIPAGDFYTVPPCRVFDTRLVGTQTNASPLSCGRNYDFTMVGGTCGVPSGAKALSLNVTVTAPSVLGNLKAFPSGTPAPAASILNYVAKGTRANNAVVSLGSAGKMSVRCSSGTTHVIVDVNGYFQ